MKKLVFLLTMVLAAGICYPQQFTFKGETTWFDGTLYRVQVGAFLSPQNAEMAFERLRSGGLEPQFGKHQEYTRVMMSQVMARDIPAIAEKIRNLGFNEVWITRESALNEKWEIVSPGSKFASFEFNDTNNYIVVENSRRGGQGQVHFGDYVLHDQNAIELIELGMVTIQSSDENEIVFSFREEESSRETNLRGRKARLMPDSPQTALFSRVWRIASVNGIDVEPGSPDDNTFLFSRAGTYLVSYSDRTTALAQWRWKDSGEIDFEYSWENWEDFGTCTIISLNPTEMILVDSTYGSAVQVPRRYRLVPVY